jgi:hypothetical protein
MDRNLTPGHEWTSLSRKSDKFSILFLLTHSVCSSGRAGIGVCDVILLPSKINTSSLTKFRTALRSLE